MGLGTVYRRQKNALGGVSSSHCDKNDTPTRSCTNTLVVVARKQRASHKHVLLLPCPSPILPCAAPHAEEAVQAEAACVCQLVP